MREGLQVCPIETTPVETWMGMDIDILEWNQVSHLWRGPVFSRPRLCQSRSSHLRGTEE